MRGCRSVVITVALLVSAQASADDNYYCSQNSAWISVGMDQTQVLAACGTPLSKQTSQLPATQKVPVQQLIYNNMGTSSAFYGVWNIPTGSGGVQLEVDVSNNKVVAVRINGSGTNAFSVCQGANIAVGDPSFKVYNSCGSPTIVNNTFINQMVPGAPKPEIWMYQASQYQSPVSLTFVNGKLQSID